MPMPVSRRRGNVHTMAMDTASTVDSGIRSQLRTATVCIGGVATVLFIAYLSAWAGTAALLFHQAEGWLESQGQTGLSIRHGELIFSGFPGRIILTYLEVNVAVGKPAVDWIWNTPALRVITRPFF